MVVGGWIVSEYRNIFDVVAMVPGVAQKAGAAFLWWRNGAACGDGDGDWRGVVLAVLEVRLKLGAWDVKVGEKFDRQMLMAATEIGAGKLRIVGHSVAGAALTGRS